MFLCRAVGVLVERRNEDGLMKDERQKAFGRGKSAAHIYGLRARDSYRYFYIGSTKYSVEQRWAKHREQLVGGRNHNQHFVRTVNAIGVENVVAELIEIVSESRFEREGFWINHFHGLTNIVKNPDALKLAAKTASADEIERRANLLTSDNHPATGLILQLVRATAAAMRAIEGELNARQEA